MLRHALRRAAASLGRSTPPPSLAALRGLAGEPPVAGGDSAVPSQPGASEPEVDAAASGAAGEPPAEAEAAAAPPPPPPRFRKRLTRKARGTYASHGFSEQMDAVPLCEFDGDVLYNARDLVLPPGRPLDLGPFAALLRGDGGAPQPAEPQRGEEEAEEGGERPLLSQQQQTEQARGEAPHAEAHQQRGWGDGESAARAGPPAPPPGGEPYPGARHLLTWRTRMVLQSGPGQRHPLSSKAEVTVKLNELAAEVGIRPPGIAFLKLLCGPRYDEGSDTLTLVSQRYYDREDNRRDLLRTLHALVDEGAAEGGGLDEGAPAAGAFLARGGGGDAGAAGAAGGEAAEEGGGAGGGRGGAAGG